VKGNLSKHGYSGIKGLTVAKRHAALVRAQKAYGKKKTLESLVTRANLNAKRNPRISDMMLTDAKWLMQGGPTSSRTPRRQSPRRRRGLHIQSLKIER